MMFTFIPNLSPSFFVCLLTASGANINTFPLVWFTIASAYANCCIVFPNPVSSNNAHLPFF